MNPNRTRKSTDTILNHHFLNRFLESNVGKKWDDVYSRLKKTVGGSPDVWERIHSSLRWNIATLTRYRQDFYVNPDTGILEKTPKKRWREYWQPKSSERIIDYIKDGDKEYDRINGIWYEILRENKPWGSWRNRPVDNTITDPLYWEEQDKINPLKIRYKEVVTKRQLNTKEVRKLLYLFPQGTNKELMARCHQYIPSYKWKT